MAYNPNKLIPDELEHLKNTDFSNIVFMTGSEALTTQNITDIKNLLDVAENLYSKANCAALSKADILKGRATLKDAFIKVTSDAHDPAGISALNKFFQEANPVHIEAAFDIMAVNLGVDSYLAGQETILSATP